MKIIAVKSGSEYINNNGVVSVTETKDDKITKVIGGDDSVTFHRTYIKDSNGKVIDADGNTSETVELAPENISFDTGKFQTIKSNVGEQDIDTSDMSFGDAALKALGKGGNTLLKGVTGLSASEWQKFGNDIGSLFNNESPSVSLTPLEQAKGEAKKEIHIDDWRDADNLNTQSNFAGTMAEDLRGEVGKSNLHLTGGHEKGWAGLGNAALSSLASGLGVGGLSQGIASFFDRDKISSAEDAAHIIELNSATKDTIYTNKPGNYIQIRSKNLLGGSDGFEYRNAIHHPGKDSSGISIALQNLEQIRRANFVHKSYVKSKDGDDFNSSIEFRKKKAIIEAESPSEATYTEKHNSGGQIIYTKNANLFTSSGLENMSEEEARYINFIKQRNSYNKKLGYIYIKPFWNYSNIKEEDFKIPFEFTPEISEGVVQANYATETLLNRLGQYHVYTGTNLSTLNITLTYEALSPDTLDAEGESELGKQYGTDAWMFYWTNNRIEAIEMKLRSLVFADVTSSSDGVLIKPPLIEIHLENKDGDNFDSVGDLYKYPGNKGSDNYVGADYLKISAVLSKDGQASRYKKYIVNSVQIEKLDDAGILYPSLYGRKYNEKNSNRHPMYHIEMSRENKGKGYAGYSRRMGFKAVIQCTEVVENFLDLVPDFKAYYDAWSVKNQLADYSSQYADIFFGTDEGYKDVTSILEGSLYSLVSNIASLNDKLIAYYNESVVLAKIYNRAVENEASSIYKLNNNQSGIYNRLSKASADIIENSKCTTPNGDISFDSVGKLEFKVDINISDTDTVDKAMGTTSLTDEEGAEIKQYLCEDSLKKIWIPSKSTKEFLGYKLDKEQKSDKDPQVAYSYCLKKIKDTAEELKNNTEDALSKMTNLTIESFMSEESLNKEFTVGGKGNNSGVVPFTKECIGKLVNKINNKWKEAYKNIFINNSPLEQEMEEGSLKDAIEQAKNNIDKLDMEEFMYLDELSSNIKTYYRGPNSSSSGTKLYCLKENGLEEDAVVISQINSAENILNTLKSNIDNIIKISKSIEAEKDKQTRQKVSETTSPEEEKFSKVCTDYLKQIKKAVEAFGEIKKQIKILKDNYNNAYKCFKDCVDKHDALYKAIVHTNLCNMSALFYGSSLVKFNKAKDGITLSMTDGEINYKENLQRTKDGIITEVNSYSLSKIKGVVPYSYKEFFSCYEATYKKLITEFKNLASENPEIKLGSTIEKIDLKFNSGEAFAALSNSEDNLLEASGENSYEAYIKQKLSKEAARKEVIKLKSLFEAYDDCIKNNCSTADDYMADAAGRMYTFFSLGGLINAFATLVGEDLKKELVSNYSEYMVNNGIYRPKEGGQINYEDGGEDDPEWVYGLYNLIFKKKKHPESGKSDFLDGNKYSTSKAGLIPSTYYKILESRNLKSQMQIAGAFSSQETLEKLSN